MITGFLWDIYGISMGYLWDIHDVDGISIGSSLANIGDLMGFNEDIPTVNGLVCCCSFFSLETIDFPI